MPAPQPLATTDDSAVHRTTLPGGLVVVTEEIPRARTAAIALLTRQGSRDERLRDSGLSHVLEHFVFRGTQPWRRVPAGRSLLEIASETDRLGGEIDAWTGRESTCYSAEVAAESFERAALLVTDLVGRPLLPADELERERAVIREEMRGYDEDPAERAHMLASAELWPRHPLGRRVEGTPRSLARFTHADIARFFQTKHVGGNMVACASGRVTHEQVVGLVSASLGHLTARPPRSGPAAPEPGQGLHLQRRARLEQAQIVLTLPGLPAAHPDLPALGVLLMALGGGVSSRAWQRIREEAGLAYDLSVEHEALRDAGRTQFHAVTAPGNVARVIGLFRDVCADICDHRLEADEFERVREGLRSSLVLGSETAGDRLGGLSWSELVHGRPMLMPERLDRLLAVTPQDVHRAALRTLRDPRRLLVVVSPDITGLDGGLLEP